MADTKTYAERFAEFGVGLGFGDLPAAVVADVKLRVQDIIGICLACTKMPYAEMVFQVAREMGGTGEASVIGRGVKMPAPAAAFVNGSQAHGVDFDDSHPESIMHPSSVIIPTALAMAERTHASGRDFIAAAVAGYEVAIRVGAAASPLLTERGYHATPLCGIFGAAVTAGKLLGLNRRQTVNALGICGSLASGTLEWLTDGTWSNRIHPGWAAQGGITATLLARRGFSGPSTIFEGQFGFYRMHGDVAKVRFQRLAEGVGEVWEILKTNFKPYPCGHYSIPFMDCARTLRDRYKIDPESIDAVECRVPRVAVRVLLEPRAEKIAPRNEYAARFSLPYSVAVIFLGGDGGIEDYSEDRIGDLRVHSLASKVSYTVDESGAKYSFPAHMRVRLRDGRTVEESVAHARGSGENPMTLEEHREKFLGNAANCLSADQAARVVAAIEDLDEMKSLERLMSLCS